MQLIIESGAYHVRFSVSYERLMGCKITCLVAELMHTLKENKSVQCLEF
jgi:hypothetical protein